LPKTSRLRDWYTGTYDQIARNKKGDVDKREFEEITAEFPPQFEVVKPLAEELRQVLFQFEMDRSLQELTMNLRGSIACTTG
jgi:hypothetical protein